MTYDLTKLVGWARRAGGDELVVQDETLVADGVQTKFRLTNDGSITISNIDVDNATAVAGDDYTAEGRVITFTTPPVDGSVIVVDYARSKYTDSEVGGLLVDAARIVLADTNGTWSVSEDDVAIDDPSNTFVTAVDVMLPRLEALVVKACAIGIYTVKANTAADAAVTVKDGDTMVNTVPRAGASEKALKRLVDSYAMALKQFRSEGFVGFAITDDLGPFHSRVVCFYGRRYDFSYYLGRG